MWLGFLKCWGALGQPDHIFVSSTWGSVPAGRLRQRGEVGGRMYPPLLFWDQVPCAPWAQPVSPSTARLLRSSCPTLVLISGGHLCAKTSGRQRGWMSPPDAPPSTPLLPSVATHPGLKAVACSLHYRALLPPISSFSVNPPAFCLLRTPHNFWLTEGNPFLLLFWLSLLPFLGELEAYV